MSSLGSIPAVILCGGRGTRFGDETELRPKPMIMIGNRPILWHIMRHYALFGVERFILCLGFKGDVIRSYFLNYWQTNHDLEVRLDTGEKTVLDSNQGTEYWRVVLAETGEDTQTGDRIRQVLKYIESERFFVTYGDGVSSVDIERLYQQHLDSDRLSTVTAVRPSSRFGELDIVGNQLLTFQEKPQAQAGWINGGFMVFHKSAFDHLAPDPSVTLERGVLEVLAKRRQLSVYCHEGFWQCMDTVRERDLLNSLWKSGNPPWLAPVRSR